MCRDHNASPPVSDASTAHVPAALRGKSGFPSRHPAYVRSQCRDSATSTAVAVTAMPVIPAQPAQRAWCSSLAVPSLCPHAAPAVKVAIKIVRRIHPTPRPHRIQVPRSSSVDADPIRANNFQKGHSHPHSSTLSFRTGPRRSPVLHQTKGLQRLQQITVQAQIELEHVVRKPAQVKLQQVAQHGSKHRPAQVANLE